MKLSRRQANVLREVSTDEATSFGCESQKYTRPCLIDVAIWSIGDHKSTSLPILRLSCVGFPFVQSQVQETIEFDQYISTCDQEVIQATTQLHTHIYIYTQEPAGSGYNIMETSVNTYTRTHVHTPVPPVVCVET